MSAQHTLGPWRLAENDATMVVTDRLDADGNCRVVADVLISPDWVNEADARLIASAPDLLEALEETWRVIDAAGLHNLTRGVQLGQTVWFVKASDAEALSKAAIAKATGAKS